MPWGYLFPAFRRKIGFSALSRPLTESFREAAQRKAGGIFRNQLVADFATDKSLQEELFDPFTGEKIQEKH